MRACVKSHIRYVLGWFELYERLQRILIATLLVLLRYDANIINDLFG